MENSSQALIIAGAIMLAILIIAIGMYIYNSASSNITTSIGSMENTKIEAFNNNFEFYKGIQTGYQLSGLLGRLISNASTNYGETKLIPKVITTSTTFTSGGGELVIEFRGNELYTESLGDLKNKIVNNHKYKVEFLYSEQTGLIEKVIIKDGE